jgi:streptogramin lyase
MQCRMWAVVLVPFYALVACSGEGTRERDSAIGPTRGAAGTSGIGAAGSSGTGTDDPCPAKGSGQVDVQITGLPDGVDADLIVGGPIEAVGVGSSRSLGTVVAGPYRVQAERVAAYDPIVRTLYDVQLDAENFCLAEGTTHVVEVHYEQVPTSHQLWTNNSNGTGALLGFAAGSLAATSSSEPSVTVTAGAGKDVTFDARGNLWSMGATVADPHLMRFPSATLGDSGEKEADRRIDIADVPCVPALNAFAFDLQGSLWVSTCGGRVSKLSPDDLAVSATVTPSVVVSNIADNGDVAFDYSGNLWLTAAGKIYRYDAARLETGTDQPPDLAILLKDHAGTLELSASNLVFDVTGGLWAIDFGSNTLARVAAADQALGGPQVVVSDLSVVIGVQALLERPAFDESGGLWLALQQGQFGRLSPEQLATNSSIGSPTLPETIITSPGMGNANRMAFFPSAADLPLYHHFR